MIGDTLSDGVANMRHDIIAHYSEEWDSLPLMIRHQVQEALTALDRAREQVDRYQNSPARLKEVE